jgi:CDP-diacylglycerol--glycerol-3-phosphate 3-phosphatidyltransferase
MSQITLPTLITSVRLLAVPVVMADLSLSLWSPWWSVLIFFVAAATDWLDGYLARKLNQESELGRFLDPLVDKLLVLGPLMSLVQAQVLPAWAVFLIISRDLIVSGWRVSGGAVVGANIWGKIKTIVQLSAITGLLMPLSFFEGEPPHALLAFAHQLAMWLFWLSVPLTVLSGVIYLWPKPHEAR